MVQEKKEKIKDGTLQGWLVFFPVCGRVTALLSPGKCSEICRLNFCKYFESSLIWSVSILPLVGEIQVLTLGIGYAGVAVLF